MLTMLLVASASCGPPDRPTDIVVYASGTDLESANPLATIHPLSRQVQRFALFVTLARYDSALAPVPYAARSWTWSNDRRELTLRLVRSLNWDDGQPTTATDVAFTILAAKDPATGYMRAADLATIDTVIAQDDSTAVVRFAVAQADLPLVFCELPILPAHVLANLAHRALAHATFNTRPVGNGPFRFVERRPGELWRFARNEAFPSALGGPPKIAGFVIAVVDEPTTKFAGLASGDLDVAGISPSMASLAKRDPSLRVIDYPILFTTGIVLNIHRPPFDDVRVREALDVAIDRTRIVDAELAGYGHVAHGPVPAESPLASESPPVLDTVRADSLLDAAGWKRGRDGTRERGGQAFSFDLLTVGSGDNGMEQLIQSDLGRLGIRMQIRQLELGAFLTQARAPTKSFDAMITGIPGDVSLSFLSAMFDSRLAGGALDYAAYHLPGLDSLFATARAAPTPATRRDAWVGVQDALARALPVVWIYHGRGVQGISARLANVRMDLRGELATLTQWDPRGAPGTHRP